jgi:hypothetical protein
MDDALPPVAAEVEPPGYFQTRGDADGTLVSTRSGIVYKKHRLDLHQSSQPQEVTPAGFDVGIGAPLAVEGTAVSSSGSGGSSRSRVGGSSEGPRPGTRDGMAMDNSWAAPYGGYMDIQLGEEPDENAARLTAVQERLQKLRDRVREREERVQGKVWREHKRLGHVVREVETRFRV